MAFHDFSAGEVLTGATLDAAFGNGGWTAYSPATVTGISSTNPTLDFAYMQIGKTMFVRGRYTVGAPTISITGAFTFSWPAGVTASAASYGSGSLRAAGVNYGANVVGGTSTVAINVPNASGTYLTFTTPTTSIPNTWAAGDTISFSIAFQVV